MYPRTDYEMTEDDLGAILEASKPVPAMFLTGGTPMFGTPQENANRAWAALGERMGFDPICRFAKFENGARVEKVWAEGNDFHPVGARATVLGSVGTAGVVGYFVEWDGVPRRAVFVTEPKLGRLTS
jgi:hypothetical protein